MIYVGGIHGAGKTTFCQEVQKVTGIPFFSASSLIKARRNLDFPASKYAADMETDRQCLLDAVQDLRRNGEEFLLDGHFCLLNAEGTVTRLPYDTFQRLQPDIMVLLREEPSVIAKRLKERDSVERSISAIHAFQDEEVRYAEETAKQMHIPLIISEGNSDIGRIVEEVRKKTEANEITAQEAEMNILRIVLTGGPYAGKTTVAQRLREVFEQQNIRVFVVPETSTELYHGGIIPQNYVNDLVFETCFLRLQIEKENTYLAAAKGCGSDRVLMIYDRGTLDSKGYLSKDLFEEILADLKISESDLLARYDAVIHMETASTLTEAPGMAPDSFRSETASQAAMLDRQLADVWNKHPHMITVGNELDFEAKLDRLIHEVQGIMEENRL